MNELVDFQNMAIATAIGFLIGFEREWHDVTEAKERHFAGARTFALVGFVGGVAGLLGVGLIAVGFASLTLLVVASYWAVARTDPETGGTTEVAFLATFLIGALATSAAPSLAAALGVTTAIILALKPKVAIWARAIEPREIGAALRFLAISVIVLPILPNAGFGPYGALNPREIWLMVVLISGLSFIGYWMAKLYGSRGLLLTGVVGGLASSTATTLSLARFVKGGAAAPQASAAGIVAANVVMLVRVTALLFVIARSVLLEVWPALVAAVLAGIIAAFAIRRGASHNSESITLGNPMELKPALFFAGLLGLLALGSRFAIAQFGDSGLYMLSAVAGLADVDALTLTTGRQAEAGALAVGPAGVAIMIAIAANIFVKGAMTWMIAGAATGVRVAVAFSFALVVGFVVLSGVGEMTGS